MGILRDLRDKLLVNSDAPTLRVSGSPVGSVLAWSDLFPRRSGPQLYNVVGEASYMPAITQLVGEQMRESCARRYPSDTYFAYSETFGAELARDPSNPYDQNAVEVRVEGRLIGHLSRAEALIVAQAMDARAVVRVGKLSLYFVWKVRDDDGKRVPFDQLRVGAKFR